MTYIHLQKVVYDEDGKIKSGSAAVMESVYQKPVDGKKGHSKHVQKEKLGKVVWLSEDKRIGIFKSPTRGLIEYNADEDAFIEVEPEDPRISDLGVYSEPEHHVMFGDVALVMGILHNSGYLSVLRRIFSSEEEFERLLAHVMGNLTRNGSKAPLDVRTRNSFTSHLVPSVSVESLRSDTRYFNMMGSDVPKEMFFKAFVKLMRKTIPDFGIGCYVDTTPLPNSIENNPFNALSSHGVGSVGVMSRLAFIVDSGTGLPIWYQIIPGNVLDFTTLDFQIKDVKETLGITVQNFVLDAGYVCKEVIQVFDVEEGKKENGKTIIARMPAKNGYPFQELYRYSKDKIGNGKYSFVRENHHYFGIRKTVKIFEHEIYAYVYVDKNNADQRFAEWMKDHEDEFYKMSDKEKTWRGYKDGFFILVSNIESTPKEILDNYFGRMTIEVGFKTIKEYLELLPLCKWTAQTVKGKILSDVICHVIYARIRECALKANMSVPEMLGICQGSSCLVRSDGHVLVDQPNKQTKAAFEASKVGFPSAFDLEDYAIKMEL